MYAECLLRGTVKPPFRALAVLAITVVLVGSSAFAQTPPSVFSPTPFVDRGAEKSRLAEEEGRKKWSGCKKQARAQKIKLRGWNRIHEWLHGQIKGPGRREKRTGPVILTDCPLVKSRHVQCRRCPLSAKADIRDAAFLKAPATVRASVRLTNRTIATRKVFQIRVILGTSCTLPGDGP